MDFDNIAAPMLIVLLGTLVVWASTLRILSLRRKIYGRKRRLTERTILSLVVPAAIVVAGNSGYDAIAHIGHSPPGRMYLVDGHNMRIDCMGSGTPTIVLEAGLGNDGLIWGYVQPILAKTTRVCSYDRAGFGWSDPLPPPRTAGNIAAELHGLLIAARVGDPIVLMGHSIGGLYIRDYASRYPASVVGLIFVDASTPSQNRERAWKSVSVSKSPLPPEPFLERAVFDLGIQHLFGACPGSFPGFGFRTAMPRLEGLCHEHLEAYASEKRNLDHASIEAARDGSYGALPILIFSRFTGNADWNQKQEDLKGLSTRSSRIIARDSGHYIQLERSELIESEVSLYIEQLRGKLPHPADYGSTTIQ
jgi:pimeloyl-ACP methyl ester carboxylesterase